MHRTNIYLDDAQVEALDRIADGEGVARSEVVRRLIDDGLRRSRLDKQRLLDAIEESFGAEPDIDLPARGPDERSAYLERLRST